MPAVSRPASRCRPARAAVVALAAAWAWGLPAANAAGPGAAVEATPDAAAVLPLAASEALRRAQVPASALVAVVQEVGSARAALRWQPAQPVNPASLAKLVTTYAALDRLGPAWRWSTPVWLTGPVQDGVLDGSLVIRGSGDPSLVLERLWLLLRRVQAAGVREIRGDIVLDHSAFAVPPEDPGAFDGEPLRPYNVAPDALLLNYRSVLYTFVPAAGGRRATVAVSPLLAGAVVDSEVALDPNAPCGDWRGSLRADFGRDGRVRFAGRYPAACGERSWPVADPVPETYDLRLVQALWQQMGGLLKGQVRQGPAPTDQPPSFRVESPDLASVVRDINKFSNNTMARQLLLSLQAETAPDQPATPDQARELLTQWLRLRLGADADGCVIDNGAGLSREVRLTAGALSRLLMQAWSSPVMPELMASLPVSGLDGTLRRAKVTPGRAHLKTGSLRDVVGVAGYVLSASGRRYVVVAIVNHPEAGAARPAVEAIVQWAMDDGPQR